MESMGAYIPASIDEARAPRIRPAVLGALAAAAAATAAICLWILLQPQGDTGSAIYPMEDMTRAQAQEMLDGQAQRSRMTVSMQPAPILRDGRLRLNFIVPSDNNGWSERVEVMQDGQEVYASGIVAPGHVIEWADAPGAHAGQAVATVHAVDGQGRDHGNPVSVEIEIREP